MTLRSNRSCATSSPPPSSEPGRGTAPVSRRALLTLSAAWATVLAVGDVTRAAVSVPRPRRRTASRHGLSPNQPNASFADSAFQIDVFARPVQDLVAVRITVSSTGSADDVFTLSYTDNKTSRESRPRVLPVAAGQSQFMDLYGGLDRTFTVKVCRGSTGECILLGPVTVS